MIADTPDREVNASMAARGPMPTDGVRVAVGPPTGAT
jgi:hypothetical protein